MRISDLEFRRVLFRSLLIGARRGAPLAVGFGNGEMYLGSDALALAPLTDRIAYMEEGDCVILSRTGARFLDADGKPAERVVRATAISGAMIGKGHYRSEERRVGTECVSTCRSRGGP